MEKYNYDFIADQEPDGNSEWYPAKEVEKEIEQYKHTLTHDTKEIKLLTAEIDQKDEEIERLRGAIIKTVQDAEVREEKLDKEIERLHEIIKCKNVLLVAYRLGTRKGVEKALDRLEALKGE